MHYLLSGSFAYDTVLLHPGEFAERILPSALSCLSVSFGVADVADHFGGTGGNIAFNAAALNRLNALGAVATLPMLVGVLGERDCDRYLSHLTQQGHNVETLTRLPGSNCSHAWILSDAKNNQITGFNSGCDDRLCQLPTDTPALWHLAPTSAALMLRLAREAAAQQKTYFFDPGQTLPSLLAGAREAMVQAFEQARGLFLNDYEAELLAQHTGRDIRGWLIAKEQFAVVTRGAQGVSLVLPDTTLHFTARCPKLVVDPTGCGDAFRAGFIHGLLNGWELPACIKLASALASLVVECSGAQSHDVQRDELLERFKECRLHREDPARVAA